MNRSIRQAQPEFVNASGAQESIPRDRFASLRSLAGRWDNCICRPGRLGYIGYRNRLLGINSLGSLNVYKFGLWKTTGSIGFRKKTEAAAR
jgi:hypothetical protein